MKTSRNLSATVSPNTWPPAVHHATTRGADAPIPRLFGYPVSPAQILNATASGLRARLHTNLAAYRTVLRDLGWLTRLEDSALLQSPAALFQLVHSPFEYGLHHLAEVGVRRDADCDDLIRHMQRITDRAWDAVKAGLGSHRGYRVYEICPGSAATSFFPSPRIHQELTAGPKFARYGALIDGARELIATWNVDLAAEIDLFIQDYALTDADFYQIAYLSVDGVPGHVRLVPLRLLDGEMSRYEAGSSIERALMAAQLVHESRHQKGFFFNRVTDPRPVLYPSGFIEAAWHREPFPAPFHHRVFQELFDLVLSFG
jgi:hypothetical protein